MSQSSSGHCDICGREMHGPRHVLMLVDDGENPIAERVVCTAICLRKAAAEIPVRAAWGYRGGDHIAPGLARAERRALLPEHLASLLLSRESERDDE